MPRRLAPGAELHERQARVQLRRKKAEVLPQLPPKIVSRIALKLEGTQRECYERAEREGVIQLREKGEAALRARLAAEIGQERDVLIESATQGRTEHFLPVAIEGFRPRLVGPEPTSSARLPSA